MTPWERAMEADISTVAASVSWWRCVCNHGPDDICANGYVYTPCGSEFCDGACEPEGNCLFKPGCCEFEQRKERTC